MKELEKTKRLSIAAVLLILIVIIALLSYEKPEHIYQSNSKDTLERITKYDYLLSLEDLDKSNHVLLDLRGPYEYEKGHLDKAINIPVSELLSDSPSKLLQQFKSDDKTIVLYGNTVDDVNAPFIFLYQLGYENVKILSIQNYYNQKELISKNMIVEDTVADVNGFIEESIKKSMVAKKRSVQIKKIVPKKVVVKKKKKKMPVEGGC